MRVKPGASQDALESPQGGRLVVRLAAPPIEGQANRALVKFLAKRLGVARSDIEIIQGGSHREKVLKIQSDHLNWEPLPR